MALNINFQGNAFDGDDNQIDCKFQAFSTNIGKWSDIRSTEYGQYNVNFGDGDLNTQSGSVSNGDVLVIVSWVGGETKDDEHQIFSATAFIYNGSDNTVQDIQLLPPTAPGCNFSSQSEALINGSVSVTSRSSTTYQWTYAGKIFYQRRSWYGQQVFGFLDISTDTFDFGNGDTSGTSTIYTSSSDFIITHHVSSTYGIFSDCQRQIRIKYHSPVGGVSFSKSSPIIDEEFNVLANISDQDNRITNIEHIFDTVTIEENIDKAFIYPMSLDSLGTYYAEQEIYWNDGFDNHSFVYEKHITLANQPPIVNLDVTQDEEDKELFVASVVASDIDGDVVDLCWKLYYQGASSGLPHPYFKCEDATVVSFKEIYQFCDLNQNSLDLIFAIPGIYKIEVTATDNMGASSSDDVVFAVDEVCDGIISNSSGECTGGGTPAVKGDCYEEVRKAVDECIARYNIVPSESGQQVLLVQDGKASNIVDGSIHGNIDGEISQSDIIASMTKRIDGSIVSSKSIGEIKGKVSGKIKK